MSVAILERLIEKFPQHIIDSHSMHGDDTAIVAPEALIEIMTFLRDDAECSFEMLTDLTGVDLLAVQELRFEVVYHLYSLSKNHRVRIKVQLPEEDPTVASVIKLWKSANWMEREAWDLYGIKFDGHPDLRRILLYPEFEGHPLRKDYEQERRQPLIPAREGREHL